MSGPFTKELSKDYFELGVDINVLFTSRYEIDGNQYDINTVVGQFHEALDESVPICGSATTGRRRQPCGLLAAS